MTNNRKTTPIQILDDRITNVKRHGFNVRKTDETKEPVSIALDFDCILIYQSNPYFNPILCVGKSNLHTRVLISN